MVEKDFSYSQEIFNDLVKDVNNIKEKKKPFLLFPRFLSYYLQQKVPKVNAQVLVQGASFQINSLSPENFIGLSESKSSKTQTEEPEQNLDESTSAP
ncbi:hypothetical protein Hanom_Chr07g00629981 [Helianthus anomalus]